MAGRERLLGPGRHIREGLPDTGSTEHPQDKELNPNNQNNQSIIKYVNKIKVFKTNQEGEGGNIFFQP